ncbi:MAG: hypothetical protein E7442_02875 [Ruminococcaceae bacterium]|nr:hypothetical protein [Oscillospiraceae bacterium]
MELINPGLAIWLPCLALCHLGLSLFLERERSLRAVIIFCACFFALQALAVFMIYGFFASPVGVLSSLCMWLYSYYCCYELNARGLSADKLTKVFDLSCLALIVMLFICSVKQVELTLVLPLGFSCAAALFALQLIRGGEGGRGRSLLIGAVAALFFGLLAAATVAFASGGITKLILALRAALLAVIGFVLKCIAAVMNFLFSLFPPKDYEPVSPELDPYSNLGGDVDLSYMSLDPQLVLGIIIGTGLLVALVAVIVGIVKGGGRFGNVRLGGEKQLRRSRLGLFSMLSRAIARFRDKLRFKLLCLRMRGTAPGLFMQLEKRSRLQLHGRAKSESCREFILRALEVYPHAQSELMRLADAMDAHCFGAGDSLSSAEIARMRRAIFTAQTEN